MFDKFFSKRNTSEDSTIKIGNNIVKVGCFSYGTEHITILSWDSKSKVEIGRFCSISFGLKIYTGGNHRIDWLSTYPFGHIFSRKMGIAPVDGHPSSKGNVIIGHDVWIGRDVTILSGLTIGSGSVIAANSTVVSDVEPYSVVGGNPAKVIKYRFTTPIIDRLLALEWWKHSKTETIKKISPFLCMQNSNSIEDNLTSIELILSNINKE